LLIGHATGRRAAVLFEAVDNGLLAPDLVAGITRIKGVKSKFVRLGTDYCCGKPRRC
jgi:hypothetical protein